MKRHYKDAGIVLKKIKLFRGDRLITIFARDSGKIVLAGFGTRKITSRRISHLETGNYVRFSYYNRNGHMSLGETELISGFSGLRPHVTKLNLLFLAFFVLDKLLPEHMPEPVVFSKTLAFLKDLNNRDDVEFDMLRGYLGKVLLSTGFVNSQQVADARFDTILFIEGLINQKVKILPL